MTYKISKTDDDWKKQLTAEQFKICRKKETERPFTGIMIVKKKGRTIVCVAMQNFFHLIQNLILVAVGLVFSNHLIMKI